MASCTAKVRVKDSNLPIYVGVHYIDGIVEQEGCFIVCFGGKELHILKEDGERLLKYWTANYDIIDCTKD